MTKRIDTTARIESVRLEEQASAPVSPDAGFSHPFVKSDGLYIVNDSDEEIGPFITGVAAGSPGASGDNTLLIYDDSIFKVTGSSISFDDNLDVSVTGSIAFVSSSGSSGGGGTWQLSFWPTENEPPLTNFATLDTRNSRPILDFDSSGGEESIFTDAMPVDYAGGGVDLEIRFSNTETGTSGNAYYSIALERIVAETTNIDNDNFATAINSSVAVPPGQTVKIGTLSLTNGAQMDGVTAEDQFRLKFTLVSGTFSGDLELHYIEMRES